MNITNTATGYNLLPVDFSNLIQAYEYDSYCSGLIYCSICEQYHENNSWCQFGENE